MPDQSLATTSKTYSPGSLNVADVVAVPLTPPEPASPFASSTAGFALAKVTIPRKKLLADFAQLGLSRLDNTEGMCWGPRRANGARALVFVSDDNFNPLQVTQFVACEFLE